MAEKNPEFVGTYDMDTVHELLDLEDEPIAVWCPNDDANEILVNEGVSKTWALVDWEDWGADDEDDFAPIEVWTPASDETDFAAKTAERLGRDDLMLIPGDVRLYCTKPVRVLLPYDGGDRIEDNYSFIVRIWLVYPAAKPRNPHDIVLVP